MTGIYLINDIGGAFDGKLISTCTAFFPKWRTEQMLKFKFFKGQLQNALGYLLLVHALREKNVFRELPDFEYNKHGKPFLKNYNGIYFSISHCSNAVAVAISEKPIGIDIEGLRNVKGSLIDFVCNDEEKKVVSESPNGEAFFKLWTQKEAVFKCVGTGITDEIKDILANALGHSVEMTYSDRIGDLWMSVAERR